MRSLFLAPALAGTAFLLGNAIAAGTWLAMPLAIFLTMGLYLLAPAAVAVPSTRPAATEAGQREFDG